jgi:hypothetical protein
MVESFRVKHSTILGATLVEGQLGFVGIGADPRFNAQERTIKMLTTDPFGNTYEADEVSPEVEAGVVVGLRCMQPYMGHRSMIVMP